MYERFLSVTIQWQKQFQELLQKWWQQIYVPWGFALFLLAPIQPTRCSLLPAWEAVSLKYLFYISFYNPFFFFQRKGWTATFLSVDFIENISQCSIKQHKLPLILLPFPAIIQCCLFHQFMKLQSAQQTGPGWEREEYRHFYLAFHHLWLKRKAFECSSNPELQNWKAEGPAMIWK